MAETTGIIQVAEIEETLSRQETSAETKKAAMSGQISSSIAGASIEAPDFYGGTQTHEFRVNLCHGGGGGIEGQEVDPTVADYIKSISRQNINSWNGKLDSSLRLTNSDLEEILK